MRSLLRSPRRRRRLGWILGLGGPVAALVVASVLIGNTGNPKASGPSGPVGDAEVALAEAAPPVEVTPAVRRVIDALVQRFVETAVLREDPAAAWELAAPSMREGVQRLEWNAGDLPVQPYDADVLASTEWRLSYVDGRTIGIDVVLHPKRGSGARPQVYAADLLALGRDEPTRLLVSSWAPLATLAAGEAPKQPGPSAAGESASDRGRFADAKLDSAWLLVPAALLSLLLLGPLVLIARGVLRARRAQRLYREHAGR